MRHEQEKPRRGHRIGPKQKLAIEFAERVLAEHDGDYDRSWHGYANSERARMKAMAKRKLIEINEFQQFRAYNWSKERGSK